MPSTKLPVFLYLLHPTGKKHAKMDYMRTAIAFVALLIPKVSSAALPITDFELPSVPKPRGIYDTTRTSGNSDEVGAAGDSSGSVNLKKRDQIAIIVIAALVVVIGRELPLRVINPITLF